MLTVNLKHIKIKSVENCSINSLCFSVAGKQPNMNLGHDIFIISSFPQWVSSSLAGKQLNILSNNLLLFQSIENLLSKVLVSFEIIRVDPVEISKLDMKATISSVAGFYNPG